MSRSVPSSPGDRKQGSLPVVGSAESLVGRVLRDQGLGKYCDPEFVRAASREMQEAMDMTPEEFDAAAHQLLTSERDGTLRLPPGAAAALPLPLPDPRWADEDDERTPLRQPGSLPGAPSRFTAAERQPSDAAAPMAPSRRRRGGGGGGPNPAQGLGRGQDGGPPL